MDHAGPRAPVRTMVSTSSMTELADLWRLQETDIALDSRRASLDDARPARRIGGVAGGAFSDEELLAAQRLAESAQRDVEPKRLNSREDPPQETKLYSGAIKSPKELGDLQADIDQLKRHLSSVEDRDLEALAAVETAERDARGREPNMTHSTRRGAKSRLS